MHDAPKRIDWLILALLCIIWGSSFILIKKGLEGFDGYQVGTLRMLIASVAFLPIFLLNIKKIDWSRWPFFLLVALLGSGIPAFLFPIAQEHVSSSLAGILNSLTPVFTLLVGVFVFGLVLTKKRGLGVLLGLIGAILLATNGSSSGIDGNWYAGLIVLATLFYGSSVNIVKHKLNDVPAVLLSSAVFVFLLPLMLICAQYFDVWGTIAQADRETWHALGYVTVLSLIGTFSATLLFYKMVQRTNVLFASSVTYLMPIVSLFWGLIDHEVLLPIHLMSMGLILMGVFLARQ